MQLRDLDLAAGTVAARRGKAGMARRVLGHSRLETTARYLTPSEDDLRAAIERAGV